MNLMLRTIRKNQDLTQGELAAKVGVSERKLAGWERGETNITLEDAVSCATALGCTPNDLCDWYATHPREGDAPASQGERRLVSAYGALSEEGREVAENVVTGLLATYPQRPDTDELGETA